MEELLKKIVQELQGIDWADFNEGEKRIFKHICQSYEKLPESVQAEIRKATDYMKEYDGHGNNKWIIEIPS